MCDDCLVAENSLDPEEFMEKFWVVVFEGEEYGEANILSRRNCLITSRELGSSVNLKILFYHR